MPRRGRKKKFKLKLNFHIDPDTTKSVLAVVFISSGVLSLISFFASEYFINAKIQEIISMSFGHLSVLVPPILILTGILFIDSIRGRIKDLRNLVGLVGLLLSFSALLQIFSLDSEGYEDAKDGGGGGLVGFKIATLLARGVSIYGAFVVLLAAILVSILFLLNISFDKMVDYLKRIWEKIKEVKERRMGSDDKDISFSSGVSPNIFDTGDIAGEGSNVSVEPSFRVVPSLSEPYGDSETFSSVVGGDTTVSSIAPGLPYTDKVWELPPLDLLVDQDGAPPDAGNVKARAKTIVETLESFGINVEVVDIKPGPSVTQYSLNAETGTKISKISSLQYDLALALASPTGSVRIEAPIPGKSLIGVEVPNATRSIVDFKGLLTSESMKSMKSKLGIVLGKDVAGKTIVYDISMMPHLLVAGATGSGKSVFLHSAIFSMLFRATPQECKFILIDPKRVELVHYRDIPHLLTPVITDIDKAAAVFKWAVIEMERRYKLFESAKARNIDAYNEKSGFQALPYIVVIVDELAEIMVADPASIEKSIIRVAQLARATGIHLILSVQRPSTNIITGLIKANIPCRVAFNVSSQVDSRVIIDQPGAEKLLGKGDMLFVPPDAAKPMRLQGPMVTDREINNVVNYLRTQGVEPDYKEEVFDAAERADRADLSVAAGGDSVDDYYNEAVEVVVSSGKGSASLLQRRLSIGYARAARILDELEEHGIVGPSQGSKPREVLVDKSEVLGDDLSLPSSS